MGVTNVDNPKSLSSTISFQDGNQPFQSVISLYWLPYVQSRRRRDSVKFSPVRATNNLLMSQAAFDEPPLLACWATVSMDTFMVRLKRDVDVSFFLVEL